MLLELDGRLVEALPVRLLVPVVGLLVTEGLLVVLVRPEVLPLVAVVDVPAVGRLLMLPTTLPVEVPVLLVRPDILPPFCPLRPLFGMV